MPEALDLADARGAGGMGAPVGGGWALPVGPLWRRSGFPVGVGVGRARAAGWLDSWGTVSGAVAGKPARGRGQGLRGLLRLGGWGSS